MLRLKWMLVVYVVMVWTLTQITGADGSPLLGLLGGRPHRGGGGSHSVAGAGASSQASSQSSSFGFGPFSASFSASQASSGSQSGGYFPFFR